MEPLRNVLAVPGRLGRAGRKGGEGVVELAPRYRLRSAPVVQAARVLTREVECVRDTGETPPIREGMTSPLPQCIGERDQVAGEIAAVDGGDVSGIERPEIARAVPVIEMAAEAIEAAHGFECRLQPLDRLGRSHPPEVAGSCCRQEIEAEIGRRRSMGERRKWVLLEVVRRQHVIGRRHEALEEPPGSTRDQPQGVRVGFRHRQPAGDEGRQTDPARHGRRSDPDRCEGCRQVPRSTPRKRGNDHRQDANEERARHPAIKADEAEVGTDRRLRRRHPFEQMPAGDEQPDQGSPDRVAHKPCLMGEKCHLQGRLDQGELDIAAQGAQVTCGRNPGTMRYDRADHGNQGRQYDRREHEDRPDE